VNQNNLLDELITLAAEEYPKANFGFLNNAIYSMPLTVEYQQYAIQLLRFARALQLEKPIFEPAYQHLLHLFVLNGSRLDMLKIIDRRLRGLVEGQSALLFISGVSGIGKTSLVMAFQERVHQLGAEFISVHCSSQGSMAFSLWQDIARTTAAVTGRPLETISAPIGKGKAVQSSQQIQQAVADWLANCAKAQSIVILLDDLHWADADSLEVLDYLTIQPIQPPILYIATYRSEDTQNRDLFDDFLTGFRRNRKFDLIQLNPLTQDDVTRLVSAYYGPCSPQLGKYLYDWAEGHPLFTVELLHDLVARDSLAKDRDGFWLPPEQTVPVPAFLKQLITQRVARLGNHVEQLLAIGAIAGESWSLKIIEPLVDLSEGDVLAAIEKALRAEIISIENDQEEIYRFSHGLIREVLYTRQLARRRKRLHGQIAEQLEQQQATNIYAIANHFFEAEMWAHAVNAGLAAGEEANRRFANFSALQWYQRALIAAERAGNALAPAVLFAIYERLGRTYMALGRREEAEIIYSRKRDVAQSSGDLIAEGHALVNLANVRMRQYQLDLAERTAYEAQKIGEKSGDLGLMTNIQACLGAVLIARGQLEQAAAYHNQALEHIELLGDSGQLLDMLRLCAYRTTWVGQYQEAEKFARLALKLSQKISDPLSVAGAYQNLAFVQIESGRYHEAYQTILSTLEAIDVSGVHHHQEPRLLNLMGYLHLELGDAQAALAWDQKALAAIQDTHMQSLEMRRYSLLNLATDYLHLGRLDEAQDTVAQFEAVKEGAEFVRFRYFNRYQLLMCEISLYEHKYEQAVELAQEVRDLAQSKGVLKNIARSHWITGQALASMLRFDEAVSHLEKAIGIVDGIQHGSLRWKIRLSLADVLRTAGQTPEGVFRQARQMIDQTVQALSGSPLQEVFMTTHWLQKVEELEQKPASRRPIYPAGLTQREVEILQLVAQGATNQQVGKALNISVRTVNTHMTSILNKTGCDNRTAASTFAIQHRLLST
jgi:predicted ATPase/DNA-binding CsgD family transcriptional regulator